MKHHIAIAKNILDSLDNDTIKEFGINKRAYLLGNIIPDLNCVYPAHRLASTLKRVNKHLNKINRSSLGILKSYRLGIATHYICDYFCYAHNNKSIGLKHKKYEKELLNYYICNKEELKEDSKRLTDTWVMEKRASLYKNISNDMMDIEQHVSLIIDTITRMVEKYSLEIEIDKKDSEWYKRTNQMKEDLEYTLFVAYNITVLIMQPFKCMVAKT